MGEGVITGEEIGVGSPVEEGNGNGNGGSTEDEGDVTGDKIHDGKTVEEGVITGEQIGDGSPVEEGNGSGGSAEEEGGVTGEQIGDGGPVEEGNGMVEEIGYGIHTETSIDDDQEGEQLAFEDKEMAIYW